MLDLHVEKIGELAVIDCEGRIVRREEALILREAVMPLQDVRIIVLDLSEVSAFEDRGLGMLLFLQRWANNRDIQFKLFNPTISVRSELEGSSWMPEFDIATAHETMALLASADNRLVSTV
jgi:anti-anti-sigma regulatory factor